MGTEAELLTCAQQSQTAQPLHSLRRQEVGPEAGPTPALGAAGSWTQ